MHPDQAQNTLSGIQGQKATAIAVIYVTASTHTVCRQLTPKSNMLRREVSEARISCLFVQYDHGAKKIL